MTITSTVAANLTAHPQYAKHAIRLSDDVLGDILAELAAICVSAQSKRANYMAASACTVVANLIAGAGPHGGSEQLRVMDAATKAGFTPEFYAGGIRVHFQPTY